MMQEREEIFPVAVSLATIVFTLELPQHRDVTAEKMGKKCRRSCYSSAAVYYWRELGSCGSACVYLHSAPAVLRSRAKQCKSPGNVLCVGGAVQWLPVTS